MLCEDSARHPLPTSLSIEVEETELILTYTYVFVMWYVYENKNIYVYMNMYAYIYFISLSFFIWICYLHGYTCIRLYIMNHLLYRPGNPIHSAGSSPLSPRFFLQERDNTSKAAMVKRSFKRWTIQGEIKFTTRTSCTFMFGNSQPKITNTISSSWFQPIWKICSSNWIISPIFGVNIKNIWNHHLDLHQVWPPPKWVPFNNPWQNIIRSSSHLPPAWCICGNSLPFGYSWNGNKLLKWNRETN